MRIGIEKMRVYCGAATVSVEDIFQARNLNQERAANLMMAKKAVGLPWEDAVTNAVNAARPLLDEIGAEAERNVEMVITATESGVDFGKSLSTYIHHYLGLPNDCRLFEIKQACYGATAALMIASGYVLANRDPSKKVLVIATDTARSGGRLSYTEPSQGTGAAAFLVGRKPDLFELDWGAFGLCSYEVMDTCRPEVGLETGDPDLSLFSYLDCLERCFEQYRSRVSGVDVQRTFNALSFHTPFGGMVKGAHRKLMRRFGKLDRAGIEADFADRVERSLTYPMVVGNIYSASLYLALMSLAENSKPGSMRVGLFSYGSGCSSEFFSGVLGSEAERIAQDCPTGKHLAKRVQLSIPEYDALLNEGEQVGFGVCDFSWTPENNVHYGRTFRARGMLFLSAIENYHRIYEWS